MRQVTAALLMSVLVVLAGCSAIGPGGGGDGSSPDTTDPVSSTVTPGPTPTPVGSADGGGSGADGSGGDGATPTPTLEPTPTPTPDSDSGPGDESSSGPRTPVGVTADSVTNGSRLAAAFYSNIGGHLEFDMTLRNSTGNDVGFYMKNDTERQIYRLSRSNWDGDTTYYVTDGADAVRNETAGTTRYGQGDSMIEAQAGFLTLYLIVPGSYISIMEWEKAETTTVDGQTAYRLTSDSINETAQRDSQFTQQGDIQSASGELTVRSDGLITTASITVTTQFSNGRTSEFDISFTTDDGEDITVQEPSWFDESEASGSSG